MDTGKVYQDSEGNDCSIMQMVRREPEWAANRIQEGEKAIAERDALRARIEGAAKVKATPDAYSDVNIKARVMRDMAGRIFALVPLDDPEPPQ